MNRPSSSQCRLPRVARPIKRRGADGEWEETGAVCRVRRSLHPNANRTAAQRSMYERKRLRNRRPRADNQAIPETPRHAPTPAPPSMLAKVAASMRRWLTRRPNQQR